MEPAVPPDNTRRSDDKLVRKEAGLRALRGTLYSTRQHLTKMIRRKYGVRKEVGLRALRGTRSSTRQHL